MISPDQLAPHYILTCCGKPMAYVIGCRRCKKCGAEIYTTLIPQGACTNSTEMPNGFQYD